MYTTINATNGHPDHGRDRGWRKAIKIAFAENPIAAAAPSALLMGPATPVGKRPARRRGKPALPGGEALQRELF